MEQKPDRSKERKNKAKRVISLTAKAQVVEPVLENQPSVLRRMMDLADIWAARQPVDLELLEKSMKRTDNRLSQEDLLELIKAMSREKPGRATRRAKKK